MRALAAFALGFAVLAAHGSARACAAFAQTEPVQIDREDALIVWDAARHQEHFVRSAVFDTAAKSFGFLVPTPTQPTFGEVGDGWVEALRAATAPPVIHRVHVVGIPIGCTRLIYDQFGPRTETASASGWAGGAFDGVHVLDETRVAGLDVTVLDASDVEALGRWLDAHDFQFREPIKRWIAPYLAKKWKITAFHYSRPDLASTAPMLPAPTASRAVRITFATDAPVYPYREPDDAPSVPYRELHLFVLGPARLDGAEMDLGNAHWTAALPFAASITTPGAVASALSGVKLPEKVWVNEFVDKASQRAATDLVFVPSASAAEVRPPPTVIHETRRIYVPYELPFVAIGAVWYWRRRRRRTRSA